VVVDGFYTTLPSYSSTLFNRAFDSDTIIYANSDLDSITHLIMPPASPLAIATSSVLRLVKEEASYYRELEQQTKRLQKLESEDPNDDDEGNRDFLLKQERQVIEETKVLLPTLRQKLIDTVAKLEQLIVEEGNKGNNSNVEQLTAAKEAVSKAKTAMREIS